MIINQGAGDGGAAFFGGFTMMTPSEVETDDVSWKRTLAHELIHLWLGPNDLRTAGPEEEWLKEGFTSYYAALTMARAGIIYHPLFFRELDVLFRMHEAEVGPSLPEAGGEKRRWYDHLYGGGAVVALCLDARLRTSSGGSTTLDSVMAEAFRSTSRDETLTTRRFVELENRLDGTLRRCRAGMEPGSAGRSPPRTVSTWGLASTLSVSTDPGGYGGTRFALLAQLAVFRRPG